jgi:hypothetical protein
VQFNRDRDANSFDAEFGEALAIEGLRSSQQLEQRRTGREMMLPVLKALQFYCEHCSTTPGLDYLFGIRGSTAEIRAERPDLLALLRIEYSDESGFRVEERRFGRGQWRTSLNAASQADAIQECIGFIARHIARMRPELAREPGRGNAMPVPVERPEPMAESSAGEGHGRPRALGPRLTRNGRR